MGLTRCFGKPKVLLGVVHLAPLPGSPAYGGSMQAVIDGAIADARALEDGGLDGAVVENFGDAPFFPEAVPPETVAALAVALAELRRAVAFPLGVNVLRNDAHAALALAAATGARFVRVNVHAGAAVTDQGLIEGRAHDTLRLRRALWPVGEAAPLLFADLEVKHAAPLAAVPLEQAAEDHFLRAGADALLITGSGTGKKAALDDVERVRRAVPEAPVLVASGVDDGSVAAVMERTHGAIVGSWLKRDGKVGEPVDPDRVRALVRAAGKR